MNGITFREDCLIGAEDALERWACSVEIPYITGLAWRGILTETLVGVSIILSLIVLLIFVRKFKK
jgi:hypothetical protein